MKESDKVEEMVASLERYITEQEKLLEEENHTLLEKGRKEFEAAIERKLLSQKREDNSRYEHRRTVRTLYGALALMGRRAYAQLFRILRRRSR